MGGKFGMLMKCSLNITLAIVISYICNWKLAFITLFTFSIIIYSSWKSLRLQVRTFYKESNLVQAGFKVVWNILWIINLFLNHKNYLFRSLWNCFSLASQTFSIVLIITKYSFYYLVYHIPMQSLSKDGWFEMLRWES